MIKFEKEGPKKWLVITDKYDDITLNLLSNTKTNNYQIVTEFIEKVAEYNGVIFVDWLINLLIECTNEDKKTQAVMESLPKLKEYVNNYFNQLDFDYDQFVDLTKVKKHSILFKGDEIKEIIRLTCYLKVYSLISNNEELIL